MNQIPCPGNNHYLLDRRPQRFSEIRISPRGLILTGAADKVLDHGILFMDGSVYACLYCAEVRNLTFLIERPGQQHIATLLFAREEDFRSVLDEVRGRFPAIRISEQNRKINRYAERIVEKLREGTRLEVRDAVREEDVIICPECGMQCEPGQAYCMECGAELPGKK